LFCRFSFRFSDLDNLQFLQVYFVRAFQPSALPPDGCDVTPGFEAIQGIPGVSFRLARLAGQHFHDRLTVAVVVGPVGQGEQKQHGVAVEWRIPPDRRHHA